MLSVIILFVELYVSIDTAVHQWQLRGKGRDGLLAVALSILAFIILWALLSPVARLVYPFEQTLWFSADTLGLLMTAGIHLVFVRFYFYTGHRNVPVSTAEQA